MVGRGRRREELKVESETSVGSYDYHVGNHFFRLFELVLTAHSNDASKESVEYF